MIAASQTSDARAPALSPAVLRTLSRRSNVEGAVQFVSHAALLAGTGTLVHLSRGSPWLFPAIVAHGIVLDFLFCALHETVHHTAFASRRANDAVALICGTLLLLPPRYFRCFHFAHHRFTQDAARDPELAQPPPRTLRAYLWRATGLPNWRRRIETTLRHALGRVREPFVPAVRRPEIVREARLIWGAYLCIAAASWLLRRDAAWVYWVLPAIVGQPFLRLYLAAEHLGCPLVSDPFANTRTTYTNAAVRFIAWQMPFHVEHHAFPSVPFHALKRANQLVADRIRIRGNGYIGVQRDIILHLRRRTAPQDAGRSPSR